MRPLAEIRTDIIRLKWHVAAARFQNAMRRHALALKAGFNPQQPRVPAGEEGAGQWVSSGDGEEPGDEAESSEATDFSDTRRRLLPPIESLSDIPGVRPETTQEINRIAREVSRNPYLAPYYFVTIAESVGHWLNERHWEIRADQEPPRSLEELQDAVSAPNNQGYDIHPIVEQTAARNQGFSEGLINGRENLVRIPRYRHWEINSWYQTSNEDYDWLSPRQYLQGKGWEEHRRIGLNALREFGVLAP